jgi:hypothetical protein
VALSLLLLACFSEPCGPGTVCTVMGTGLAGFTGEGDAAPMSALYLPSAVALDPDGRPCVVDYNNMRVRCLDAGRLLTVAGNGEHGWSVPGANALETPLENPIDAMWSPEGRLTVLATHESRVIQLNEDGVVEVIAGTGAESYSGDGGPALSATFAQPCGMTWADDGALWIADTQNGAVRRVDEDGIVETVLSGLDGVVRVRPSAEGAVLVADTWGGRVLRLFPDGRQAVLAEGLAYPWSAREDGEGVLVAESGGDRVLRFVDGEVTVIGGTGERGFSGDGGPAVDARFNWPADVLRLEDGSLLVADMQNARVRVIHAGGE